MKTSQFQADFPFHAPPSGVAFEDTYVGNDRMAIMTCYEVLHGPCSSIFESVSSYEVVRKVVLCGIRG
jgi:hypothetical protein